MILSRTPLRVSLLGGGSDYPQWYSRHGGACLVSAIDKYCYVTLRYQPQFFNHISRVCWTKVELVSNNLDIQNPAVRGVLRYFNKSDIGFEIHHQGDLPARSGMGSSSSFIVGLLNAHWALTYDPVLKVHGPDGKLLMSYVDGDDRAEPMSLAKTAVRIERDYIGDTVGCQDQYAAALGGVNLLRIERDGTVHQFPCWAGVCNELQENLILIYLGTSRHASEIAKVQVAEMADHESEMIRLMEQAEAGYDVLTRRAPLSDIPDLLNEAWTIKRRLSPVISNPEIDGVADGLRANGAQAVKLIGAGGAGFMLAYVKPDDRSGLCQWASEKNLLPISFEFCYTGSEIIFRERS